MLGGTQALARSYFSLLIPRGKEAEYFSFYHAMDRGTSWFGTLVFGLVYQFTDSYRPAIFALIVFFVLGGLLLHPGRHRARHPRGRQRRPGRRSEPPPRTGAPDRVRPRPRDSSESWRRPLPLNGNRGRATLPEMASRTHRSDRPTPDSLDGRTHIIWRWLMAERTLRGARLGGQSFEDERGIEFAARQQVGYRCPQGHEFEITMSVEADIPAVWECPRCGAEALSTAGIKPEEKAEKPARTHWDMLLERRSEKELEDILKERLELLRGGEIGPAHLHRANAKKRKVS